jgi:Thioesterase-like superfamily
MTNNFSRSTTLKALNHDTHNIVISDLWNVGKIPNGGYLMAHAALAIAAHSEHPHPLSVTGYYLDKSDNGEAQVKTELLRSGKSISNFSSSLIQENSERIRFTAAFTDFGQVKGESFCEEQAPSIKTFENCIPVKEVAPYLRIYDQFDMRFDPKSVGWNHGKLNSVSEMNVWLEFKDGSLFDVFSLLMVPDVLPPAVFNRIGPNGWVPTIQMTVNIKAIPQTTRIQIRARTRYLTNSILEEDVEVWDDKANLLATSRQIAKLRIAAK